MKSFLKRPLVLVGAGVLLVVLLVNWRRALVVPYGYSPRRCRVQAHCGILLGIDCGSAADGPYNYHRIWSWNAVSYCGGACMGGRCQNCPPAEWTCGR